MRHGDEYFAAFKLAAEKSLKWQLVESANVRRTPDAGRAVDCLDLVGQMVNSLPYDSTTIRISCGQIHSFLFKALQDEGVQCILTVGDVEVDGKREYETSYQKLKQEIRGAHRDTDKPYPFHVWLTFPDLHIIDATFFIYKWHDKLPEPWHWPNYLICSDHAFAEGLELRYHPMLVGDDLVGRMIYSE